MCVTLFKVELNLSHPIVRTVFYSLRSWKLHCDPEPDS
jgi:hypothetical protein